MRRSCLDIRKSGRHPMDATLTITDVVVRGPRIEKRKPLWMFTLRSPASVRSVLVAFAPHAQAAIFEGHVLALAAFAGVPYQRIRYPRLQPAVLRIMQGRDRTARSRSPRRRSYYGFPEFDYELGMKGAHTARRARPTGSVAPPGSRAGDCDSSGAQGADRHRDGPHDDRRIEGRTLTVGEAFELEAPIFNDLPVKRFDSAKVEQYQPGCASIH